MLLLAIIFEDPSSENVHLRNWRNPIPDGAGYDAAIALNFLLAIVLHLAGV